MDSVKRSRFTFEVGFIYLKMYNYESLKKDLFTEQGQVVFLKIRDNVQKMLSNSGAFMMQNAWQNVSGDTWLMLACVDRLVELKEIRELTLQNISGQHRVFVGGSY